MKKTELIAARQAAGEAYRAAALAYVSAWEKLHCLDLTYGNGNLNLTHHAPSFASQPEVAQHAEFMRDAAAIQGRAVERAKAAHEQMLNKIKD